MTPLLDDDTIEALVRGGDVHPRHRDLAAFAAVVRATGDGPPPAPSAALAAMLADGTGLRPGGGRPAATRRTAMLAKIAGLGVAVKLTLGVSAAAAGALGAGAAGVLPDAADNRARQALEVVTPLDFPDPDADAEPGSGEGPNARGSGNGAGTTGTTGTTRTTDAPGGGRGSGTRGTGQGADGPTAADQSERGVAQNAPAGSPPDDGSLPDQAEEHRPEVTPPSTIPAGPPGAGNGGQPPTTLPDEAADDEDIPADQRAHTEATVP